MRDLPQSDIPRYVLDKAIENAREFMQYAREEVKKNPSSHKAHIIHINSITALLYLRDLEDKLIEYQGENNDRHRNR